MRILVGIGLLVLTVVLHTATPPWHKLDDMLTTVSVLAFALSMFILFACDDGVSR